MPGIIEFDLDVPEALDLYPARLHGAACALLELPSTEHKAQQKPFTVWPVTEGKDGAGWRLGWLPERRPPLRPVSTVLFGEDLCPVRSHGVATSTFAQLAGHGATGSAELRMVSPTYFSRNGRDHPFPDPVLVVDSAVRRWNVYAPVDLQVPSDEHQALRKAVVLADFDGRTVRSAVTYTMQQTGFVGTVRLGLPRAAERSSRYLLGALMRFVEIAGVGAQTTHGFGAVELLTLGGRTAR